MTRSNLRGRGLLLSGLRQFASESADSLLQIAKGLKRVAVRALLRFRLVGCGAAF